MYNVNYNGKYKEKYKGKYITLLWCNTPDMDMKYITECV